MCVALPGKVIELDKGDALVDFMEIRCGQRQGWWMCPWGTMCWYMPAAFCRKSPRRRQKISRN